MMNTYSIEEIFPNTRSIVTDFSKDYHDFSEVFKHWKYWRRQWRDGFLNCQRLELVKYSEQGDRNIIRVAVEQTKKAVKRDLENLARAVEKHGFSVLKDYNFVKTHPWSKPPPIEI